MALSPAAGAASQAQRVEHDQDRAARHRDARRSAASRSPGSRTAPPADCSRTTARSSAAPGARPAGRRRAPRSTGASRSPWNTASAAVCAMSTALGRRQRDIGRGQRRRVVEPVADHQHPAPARRPSASSRARLAGGRAAGLPVGDAELAGDPPHRRLAVAGQQRHARSRAAAARPTTAAASARSRSTKANRTGAHAGPRQPQLRPRPRRPRATPAAQSRRPSRHSPSRRGERAGRSRRSPRRRSAPAHPARRAASARPADGGDAWPCRRARRRAPASTSVGDQLQPAEGQRAGLVEHHHVGPGEPLQRGRRLEQHAAAHQPAAGQHLHRRHGQPERAGAGDDQHGDGVEQRRLPGAAPAASSRGRSAAPGCARPARRRGPPGRRCATNRERRCSASSISRTISASSVPSPAARTRSAQRRARD